jgi:hypothetical protein
MNINKNISDAVQSVGLYFAAKHLFPQMGRKRRFLLFLLVNDTLAYMEDPSRYHQVNAKVTANIEAIKRRWAMADPDYAMSSVKKVDLGPITEES